MGKIPIPMRVWSFLGELGIEGDCSVADAIGYWKFDEGEGITILPSGAGGAGGSKNYCDYDCAGPLATSLLWYGGWVPGYLF